MMEKYEFVSETDIVSFNGSYGKYGITAGHDLLGSPVLYVDTLRFYASLAGEKQSVRKRVTDQQKADVIRLHGQGKNYREISSITGVSLGKISEILNQK